MSALSTNLRRCLREPISDIFEAARYLDQAVTAHFEGQSVLACDLIRRADMPVIRDWTESIWGRNSPYVQYRAISGAPPKTKSAQGRMPTAIQRAELLKRDGHICRFCGIPLIRWQIRKRIRNIYPDALKWGKTNSTQHAAFQAMWVQYDHVLPYTRGGSTEVSNLVITCAPCNFGRMEHILEEVGLIDPNNREISPSTWDGLERFH